MKEESKAWSFVELAEKYEALEKRIVKLELDNESLNGQIDRLAESQGIKKVAQTGAPVGHSSGGLSLG